MQDTIFALATAAGRAAIAVMRLSGPHTGELLRALAGPLPTARRASLRRLHYDGEELDRAVILWLPAPHSYTGDDCAELSLHGGPAVIDAVAFALAALGARPAEPGEFTRRAFLNNRMELTEAEAVADLIEAETAAQRRQALRQLDGDLARLFDGWAGRLKHLLAEQEARIDFADEIAGEAADTQDLPRLIAEIAAHLDDDHRGERIRAGLEIAIVGPPNVGKSSLFNALCGRDAAIVAATPGTTRDIIEARIILAGIPVTLLDTAGLRLSSDPIEAEGIRRAQARAATADLVLAVHESGTAYQTRPGEITIATKTDLDPCEPGLDLITGDGLAGFRTVLERYVRALVERSGPAPLTRARHRAASGASLSHLEAASAQTMPELVAEELRLAMRQLGRVTGRVGVEDLLDLVFSQFCIGK